MKKTLLVRVNQLFTVTELNEWQSTGVFNLNMHAFYKSHHTNGRWVFLVFRKEIVTEIILNVLENLEVYIAEGAQN